MVRLLFTPLHAYVIAQQPQAKSFTLKMGHVVVVVVSAVIFVVAADVAVAVAVSLVIYESLCVCVCVFLVEAL